VQSLDDAFAQLSNHFIYRTTYKKYHWTFKEQEHQEQAEVHCAEHRVSAGV
jgi:hypothetical protein